MKPVTLFICGMLLLFIALCTGLTLPFEVLLMLGIGWLLFLFRDLPVITFDWSAIAGAIVLAVVFTVGLHSLLHWIWRERKRPELPTDGDAPRKAPRRWSWRWTTAAVAIILLAFVAGISMVGITHQLVWLATAKGPLTQSSMRDFSERGHSGMRLKQLGIALFPYLPRREELPPGVSVDAKGHVLHGWQTLILPYMEQPQLASRVDLNQPWYTPANRAVFATPIDTYGYASARFGTEPANGMAPSVYAGNSHVLGGTRRFKESDIGDGLSNTILAGEVVGNLPAWGRPGNWRDPADGLAGDDDTFGSPWKKGVNFLLADGSTIFINREIDPKVLRAYATPNARDDNSMEDPRTRSRWTPFP